MRAESTTPRRYTRAVDPVETVDHALRTTRSVRRRLDFERPVPPEVIEECIATAVQAPTGLQREGWRFVVVTDPARKRALAALYRDAFEGFLVALGDAPDVTPPPPPGAPVRQLAERLETYPALILVCSVGRPQPDVAHQVAFYGSVLPAAWSLMVALRARGIGSTWTSLLVRHEQRAAEILGIPEDVTQTVLLPIGYMRDAVLRPAERRGPREVTYWETWGQRR